MIKMKSSINQELLQKCSHRLLNTAKLLEIRFHSQNLFPLYCLTIETKQANKMKIAAKELTDEAMADVEYENLDTLDQLDIASAQPYGYVSAKETGKVILFMKFIDEEQSSHQPNRSENLHKTLLRLYQNTHTHFGWHRRNYIGPILQTNHWHQNFYDFWWNDRILPQINSAKKADLLSSSQIQQIEKLVSNCVANWSLEKCTPRLIHGDLWSGNLLAGPEGQTHLIDPSLSYSHPEQDLGMLGLFGSPLSEAHKEDIAIQVGAGSHFYQRNGFWQIYPLLVHVNLFGSSYLNRLQAAIHSSLDYT